MSTLSEFFNGTDRPRIQVFGGFGGTLDPGADYIHLSLGPGLGTGKLAGPGVGVNEIDITSSVRSLSISQRGPTSDVDAADPVTCAIVVNNASGDFDPTNPASPYTGQLVDGLPVRVRWSWAAAAYDRFYGELSAITHQVANSWDITATLTCVDGQERLGRAYLPSTLATQDAQLTGARVSYLADQAAWPTALRSIDTGSTTLGPTTLGASAGELMASTATTEFGMLFVDGAGRVVFYERHRGATAARSTVTQATFGDAAGSIPLWDIDVTLDRARTFNRVAITRDAQAQAPLIVGDNVFDDSPDEPVEQVADDLTSQATKGVLAFPAQVGQLSRNDLEALALAQYLVQRYADTAARINQLNVSALSCPASLYGTLLSLGPLDLVAVDQDYGPADITASLHIQSVTEEVSSDPLGWALAFTTSPPPPDPGLFIVGTDQVGVGTLGW